MKAALITFPGSNRERDMRLALTKANNGKPPIDVWHGDADLPPGIDLIVLPGGFSYGDYLRCGAMAAHSPIMREVKKRADQGVRVLAVCNGFQIACEAGLLPGTLITNASLKFICKEVNLRVETTASDFTRKYRKGQTIRVPVAHHDGNYTADEDTLKKLEDQDRIAFRYADALGNVAPETNLNGSVRNIAGVYNEKKTVLGLMPHPEDATDPLCGGTDGMGLFESIAESLA
ncbi:phosphoribosylformylglycinamidine synthase subunit PurQ [uncultured Ferrovibrio sp.]|mgnify:CR=1 FL=1|jgi:phosphoribosylformylglycinamidine synthase I|uniref:phosphoribosylformylglycinamidine synthase subunit PurQ n=1 Tax=uncultured Ferrovibrio sp. TaxID=1576913 RepID=UPI00262C0E78|nr:phosphoribosylformylglycinamidine synthase subunit PurQ [uncultured Ferrovibrio sp.]